MATNTDAADDIDIFEVAKKADLPVGVVAKRLRKLVKQKKLSHKPRTPWLFKPERVPKIVEMVKAMA